MYTAKLWIYSIQSFPGETKLLEDEYLKALLQRISITRKETPTSFYIGYEIKDNDELLLLGTTVIDSE